MNVPTSPSSVYFSGAGIYFWWQMGAAKYMKENCDPKLWSSMTTVGASAGSITASLLRTNADLDLVPYAALEVANEIDLFDRKTGLAGIWGSLLRKWLDIVIPESLNPLDLQDFYIAITPTFKSPKLVTNFQSKEDLIDAIMASCHVPVFLDGRPFTEYKGEQVLDGSFWYFVTKDRYTGLPLPTKKTSGDIYWVDYCDDEDFLHSVSGNFLELTSPDGMFDMIESGYNFMKREHYNGKLPQTRNNKPNSNFASPIKRTLIDKKAKGDTELIKKVSEGKFGKIMTILNKNMPSFI